MTTTIAALTEIDLDVASGEVVALVGDNGAGKSTLVKVLSGVHSPDTGTVEFDGERGTLPSPMAALDRGIATVFQDLALCDNLDVVQNLFLGREQNRIRLDEVQMEVKAWELLKRLSAKIPSVRIPIASLSGGQRQTVAIARSLLGDPKLVILDEPTAALDVAQTTEVLNLVERLREHGLGVILVSHNMEDVRAVADRVAILRLGRNNGTFIVRDTSTEEILPMSNPVKLSTVFATNPLRECIQLSCAARLDNALRRPVCARAFVPPPPRVQHICLLAEESDGHDMRKTSGRRGSGRAIAVVAWGTRGQRTLLPRHEMGRPTHLVVIAVWRLIERHQKWATAGRREFAPIAVATPRYRSSRVLRSFMTRIKEL